ncbi:AzlC family ABC transporter permease [Pelagibius sp.]|uniref:AzlC family ABC transporter permease n=1 Tax=Pelagibius sp. TaxID=1931238 RepID=UPI002AC36A9C|nr:AzlC family ABC transporter permease [Pelagibius sp.]
MKTQTAKPHRRHVRWLRGADGGDFMAGLIAIAPLLIPAAVFGLLLGSLGAQKGLSPLEMAVMSATVFAGASQLVAVEIWTSPPAIALLGLTALTVNLRHVLMGATIVPSLTGWSRGQVYGGLFFLADEIWALALKRSGEAALTPSYYAGLFLIFYLCWVASTTLGAIFGGLLEDPQRYGLDFAFTAVFLTLLVGMWKGRRSLPPWLAAALAAVAAYFLLPGVWYIALGGIAGAVAGALQGPAQGPNRAPEPGALKPGPSMPGPSKPGPGEADSAA